MHKGIFKTIGVILVAGILLAPTIGYVQGKDPKDIFLDFVEKIKKVDEKIKTLDQEIADLLAKLGDKSGDSSTPPVGKPSKPPTTDITIDPENQRAIDKLRRDMETPPPVVKPPKIAKPTTPRPQPPGKIIMCKIYLKNSNPNDPIWKSLIAAFPRYSTYFEVYIGPTIIRIDNDRPTYAPYTTAAELEACIKWAQEHQKGQGQSQKPPKSQRLPKPPKVKSLKPTVPRYDSQSQVPRKRTINIGTLYTGSIDKKTNQSWCGPCNTLKTAIKELETQYNVVITSTIIYLNPDFTVEGGGIRPDEVRQVPYLKDPSGSFKAVNRSTIEQIIRQQLGR